MNTEIDIEKMKALAAKLRKFNAYATNQAAIAIDTLLSELEAREADRRVLEQRIIGAQAAQERCVQILSAIHRLIQPPDVKLEDGRVMRFSKPDLQIECYRQLSERIRTIPDELAALAQRQEGEDDERA